jgi:hypothetical protein
MNDQSDLVWGSEIAGMDLLVALGEEDPAADVGVIPAQSLQTVQLRGRGGSRDELRQALLILFRKNKAGAHGMLA